MFSFGKFDGDYGVYETKDYTYHGNFINGKKDGFGVLITKSKNISKDITKPQFLPE